ncbi:hypothetical protein D3C80_1464560 [compost metagenome]
MGGTVRQEEELELPPLGRLGMAHLRIETRIAHGIDRWRAPGPRQVAVPVAQMHADYHLPGHFALVGSSMRSVKSAATSYMETLSTSLYQIRRGSPMFKG